MEHLPLTETWNGSSWTEVAEFNTARNAQGGAGTQTLALMYGGASNPGAYVGLTESWDGSSWTEVADMASGRGYAASGGTGTAAFMAGGNGSSNLTEEWTVPEFVTKTFTVS